MKNSVRELRSIYNDWVDVKEHIEALVDDNGFLVCIYDSPTGHCLKKREMEIERLSENMSILLDILTNYEMNHSSDLAKSLNELNFMDVRHSLIYTIFLLVSSLSSKSRAGAIRLLKRMVDSMANGEHYLELILNKM